MKFLGHTGATNHTTPLENSYTQSRHAQIGGTGQAIVAGTDYDCVNIGHGFANRHPQYPTLGLSERDLIKGAVNLRRSPASLVRRDPPSLVVPEPLCY